MSIADLVKQSAIEAKKYGLRQSRDGVILSFVLHPDDVTNAILLAPVGQRGMLAFVPIGDDEKPEQPNMVPDTVPAVATTMDEPEEHRDRAINSVRSERGKVTYRAQSPAEQAVTRSAMLCNDPEFIEWCRGYGPEGAAHYIRIYCGVTSRKNLAFDAAAGQKFLDMEHAFNVFAGRTAEPR